MNRFIKAVFLLFTAQQHVFGGDVFTCPEGLGLNNTKQELIKPIEGWQVMQESAGHMLQGGGVLETMPYGLQSMYPKDDPNETATSLEVNYSFDLTEVKEPWLSCSYYSTSLQLKKKIPAKFKKCISKDVRYDTKSPFQFKSIVCTVK